MAMKILFCNMRLSRMYATFALLALQDLRAIRLESGARSSLVISSYSPAPLFVGVTALGHDV
jgi:hypothetical protein